MRDSNLRLIIYAIVLVAGIAGAVRWVEAPTYDSESAAHACGLAGKEWVIINGFGDRGCR